MINELINMDNDYLAFCYVPELITISTLGLAVFFTALILITNGMG